MNTFFHVSNHESGDITRYSLADEPGVAATLTALSPVAASRLVMPLAASPDGRFLHAAVRAQPFHLLSYAADAPIGGLSPLGATPVVESFVAILVDRSGRWLLAAAYGADELFVYPIDASGRPAAVPGHRGPSGGVKPHALCLDSSNRFLYVPHLGTDEIRLFVFDADTGTLAPHDQPGAAVRAGSGPRHLVLSPDERFLYVLGQLDGSVTVFRRDAQDGRLQPVQSISSLPPGSPLMPGKPRPPSGSAQMAPPETDVVWCADIQITPRGDFLYTTERAKSTISIFAVDPLAGELRFIGHTETERQPRAIAIDPSGRFLVASGEASVCLSLYAIDPATGALTLRGQAPSGAGANWMLFAPPRA